MNEKPQELSSGTWSIALVRDVDTLKEEHGQWPSIRARVKYMGGIRAWAGMRKGRTVLVWQHI